MSDNLYVNRDNTTYQVDMENLKSIEDTDLLLVNRNGTTYTVTGDKVAGGATNNLNPAIPPFVSKSGPATTVTNSDGKVEFSLDETDWSSSLTIPAETIYYCDWTDDILSAAHNSQYETSINVDYPNLNTTQDIELELKIDKLPDPFSFTALTDVQTSTDYIANTISPLDTINAPVSIWGSSTALSAQMAIADGPWVSIPSAINTGYVNRNERIRIKHTTGTGSSTDYETAINIGFGTAAGEFESSTFTTTTEAVGVNSPIIGGDIGNDAPSFPVFTGSAYTITGQVGTHASTDWQLATDAGFESIVHQSLSDATNLLSWTPYAVSSPGTGQTFGRLDGSKTYYVRSRYRSDMGFESDWGDATLTSVALKEDFNNGTKEIGLTNTTWTVPADVGRVRVTLTGSNGSPAGIKGGTVKGHFKVMPGEQLQIFNCGGAVGLWTFGYTTADRDYAFAVAGNAGGEGYRHGDLLYKGYGAGGHGGGQGGSGQTSDTGNYASGGGGGSQTGPGSGGAGYNWGPGYEQPVNGGGGSGFSGGNGGEQNRYGDKYRGGKGGAGWYGGGGGGVAVIRDGAAGGGGGSNRWQTPTGAGWRDCTQLESSTGTATTGIKLLIEY